MLVWNFWGNALIEQIESNVACTFEGLAQSFELLFLVSTYCTVFMYGLFVACVRECMKRYYLAIELNPAILQQAFNPNGFQVHVFRTRSLEDFQDAVAYAFWFLINGRVGSRRDRQYLEEERSRRRFAKMSDSILSYCYEDDVNEDDQNKHFTEVDRDPELH